jgi:hypothetical protein
MLHWHLNVISVLFPCWLPVNVFIPRRIEGRFRAYKQLAGLAVLLVQRGSGHD